MTPEQLQSNLQKAIKLHQSQQLARAETLYKKILKAFPESPDALHFYGLLHFHRGQLAPAKELMLAAVAYNPNYFDAYLNLGNLFLQTLEFDNTRKCYEKALELKPENVGAATNYGILLCHQGAPEESENILRRVCQQHPDLAVA